MKKRAFIVTETVSLFELLQELLDQFEYEAVIVSDQNGFKVRDGIASKDLIVVIGLGNKLFKETLVFFQKLRSDFSQNRIFWLTDYSQPYLKYLIDLGVVSLPQKGIVDSFEVMMSIVKAK